MTTMNLVSTTSGCCRTRLSSIKAMFLSRWLLSYYNYVDATCHTAHKATTTTTIPTTPSRRRMYHSTIQPFVKLDRQIHLQQQQVASHHHHHHHHTLISPLLLVSSSSPVKYFSSTTSTTETTPQSSNAVLRVQNVAAFSHDNAGSNPAGVLLLLPAEEEQQDTTSSSLTDQQTMDIAKDVRYSETNFLRRRRRRKVANNDKTSDDNDDWYVRYCVHATIAGRHVLEKEFDVGNYNLQFASGDQVVPIQVSATSTSTSTVDCTSSSERNVYATTLQSPSSRSNFKKNTSNGISRRDFYSTTREGTPGSSLEDFWRNTTSRILDPQAHEVGSFDSLLWQTTLNLILWWAERPEGIDISLKLLDRMVDEAVTNRLNFRIEIYVIHSVLQNWKRAIRNNQTNILPSSLLHRIDGYLQRSSCFEPNIVTYTIILDGASHCSIPDERLRLSEKLLRRLIKESATNPQLRPTVVTFGSVMNCFAQSGSNESAESAEALLRELEELHSNVDGWQDVEPNSILYTSCIHGWAKAGNAHRAECLMREMYEKYTLHGKMNLAPNRRTFNTVLAAWARSSSSAAFESAESLLRKMQELYQSGRLDSCPDVVSYNCVLSSLAGKQVTKNAIAVAKAEALLNEMITLSTQQIGQSISPNENTFTNVINIVVWSDMKVPDKLQKVQEILELMKKFGVPSTSYIAHQVQKLEEKSTLGLQDCGN